jgi:beta-glucanase (GH16 family)
MEGTGFGRRRRAIGVALVVLFASGAFVVLADAPAGAARVTARGAALCGAAGRVTFKPPLRSTPRPTVMTIRAQLGCIAGETGAPGVTVHSGRMSGASLPFTASCQSLGVGVGASTVRWKASKGSVAPTQMLWTASAASPTALTFDLAGSGTGSYAGQKMSFRVIGDATSGGLCGAGAARLAFSGTRGTSLLAIGAPGVTVLFEDRFDGTTLDRSKWRPNWLAPNDAAITKPVNSNEQSCYDPAQVSVGGGVLHLRAVARLCTANNGITYPYASGLVETAHDFTFTFGRVEARLWLPPGSGPIQNWPAFWTNGTGQFPVTGELDVFEGLEGRACWHFHSLAGAPGGCASPANPSGWHTFAADWQPGSVTYFYDGVQVGRITSGITAAPMYLVLNLGVSSGISPPVTLPSEVLVDYVRVTR